MRARFWSVLTIVLGASVCSAQTPTELDTALNTVIRLCQSGGARFDVMELKTAPTIFMVRAADMNGNPAGEFRLQKASARSFTEGIDKRVGQLRPEERAKAQSCLQPLRKRLMDIALAAQQPANVTSPPSAEPERRPATQPERVPKPRAGEAGTPPPPPPPVAARPPEREAQRPVPVPPRAKKEPSDSETRLSFKKQPKDRLAAIDEILAGLDVGNIVFNAPTRMAIDEPTTIQLVLGIRKTLEQLKQQITARGEQVEAQIRVSDRMEARLSGANFSITALTPEVQAISRNESTEWKWEIVPKKSGKHVLHLTLDVLLDIEGSMAARNLRTFDQEIEVQVAWSRLAQDFVQENWQWLWATILVPLAPWIWKKLKRRRAAG